MRRLALVALVMVSAVACGGDTAARRPSLAEVPLTSTPTLTPTPTVTEPVAGAAVAPAPPAKPELIEIRGLGDLKARFDADQGKPRLVLLVSPT